MQSLLWKQYMLNQKCFERLTSLGDEKIFCAIKPNYAHSGRPPWQSKQIPPVRNVLFFIQMKRQSFPSRAAKGNSVNCSCRFKVPRGRKCSVLCCFLAKTWIIFFGLTVTGLAALKSRLMSESSHFYTLHMYISFPLWFKKGLITAHLNHHASFNF